MSEYLLVRRILGRYDIVDLTKSEYENLLAARNGLLVTLQIEESFDLLVDDYLEFETTILKSSFKNIVRFTLDYFTASTDRRLFNRTIMHLLTTSRSYIDQSRHHLSTLFGAESIELATFNKTIEEQYNTIPSYRIIDSIRNFVQHRGWPVHDVHYDFRRINKAEEEKILFSVIPFITLKYLDEDKKIKKSIKDELRKSGKQADIRPLTREYIESLGQIHTKLRQIMNTNLLIWETAISDLPNKFDELSANDRLLGYDLRQIINNEKVESSLMLANIIELRKNLETKNRDLVNLSKCFVTSETKIKQPK